MGSAYYADGGGRKIILLDVVDCGQNVLSGFLTVFDLTMVSRAIWSVLSVCLLTVFVALCCDN
jgi:hypothetical protein